MQDIIFFSPGIHLSLHNILYHHPTSYMKNLSLSVDRINTRYNNNLTNNNTTTNNLNSPTSSITTSNSNSPIKSSTNSSNSNTTRRLNNPRDNHNHLPPLHNRTTSLSVTNTSAFTDRILDRENRSATQSILLGNSSSVSTVSHQSHNNITNNNNNNIFTSNFGSDRNIERSYHSRDHSINSQRDTTSSIRESREHLTNSNNSIPPSVNRSNQNSRSQGLNTISHHSSSSNSNTQSTNNIITQNTHSTSSLSSISSINNLQNVHNSLHGIATNKKISEEPRVSEISVSSHRIGHNQPSRNPRSHTRPKTTPNIQTPLTSTSPTSTLINSDIRSNSADNLLDRASQEPNNRSVNTGDFPIIFIILKKFF